MKLFDSNAKVPPIDRRRSLASVPVLNPEVDLETDDSGRVKVTVSREPGKGLLARFQPKIIKRSFRLDELGSYVVRQVDGERNVKVLIDRFVADHQVNRREAELCIVEFLKMLMSRNIIAVVVEKEGSS